MIDSTGACSCLLMSVGEYNEKTKDEISCGREQEDGERGGPFIVSASGVKNATLSPIRNGDQKTVLSPRHSSQS